ncbi:MAG TPA: hypothetical protein VML75_14205 [Kofleriaceae bacterium]|nr:hypothetical protein [Kofleriaceae bacterium]
MRGAVVLTAMLAVQATATSAYGQGVHWPRQHAEPPLEESVSGALPPPPSPVERGERAATNRTGPRDDGGGYTYEATGFEARVGADGRVRFHDRSSVRGDGVVTPFFLFLAGTLDVTELVMRRLGQDPYALEKRAFLESTFEARAGLRMRFDEHTMRTALGTLPRYLGRVWDYRSWDPEMRKRVLFALWDECAEGGNELMRQGGAQARAIIEAFVRRELPQDSPQGFSAADLAALNRVRSSEQVFAPYRAGP